MNRLDIKIVATSLATFSAVMFAFCVAYGLIVPPRFHAAPLLEMVLPGFRWLSTGSFILGLVETFLYGAFAGVVFVPIYNRVAKTFERHADTVDTEQRRAA